MSRIDAVPKNKQDMKQKLLDEIEQAKKPFIEVMAKLEFFPCKCGSRVTTIL